MSAMSDEEMGELLEIMDFCDELMPRLAKINKSVRFSDIHKREIDNLALEINKIASIIEKTCKSHCPFQDQNVPVPNHFNLARKAWKEAKLRHLHLNRG